MSYVDQSRRPSPASMAAVVAIHAAIGSALVLGLAVSGKLPEIIVKTGATNIPIPPPPPEPIDDPAPAPRTDQSVVTPVPTLDLKPRRSEIDTTLVPLPGPTPQPGLEKVELPAPTPKPSFEPLPARARNDPARWLTDNDYRPSWSRRELAGLAGFRLAIAMDGKIAGCSITKSTGHPELDQATCTLVSKRAKFEPARGANGEPVAGSYSGSVMWELPD